MSASKTTLRLYYLPLSFPRGPQSSCCGPIGQSEEELQGYVAELKGSLPEVEVQTIDVNGKLQLGRDGAVLKLLNSFGAMACPVFALDGEVLSMGPPSLPEVIEMVKARLGGQR